jgi:hypothetical protein
MPAAAGIVMATGLMTMINDMVQDSRGDINIPATAMIDNIPWKVIPATAIAAGLFYGLEQVNASVAAGLAALAFMTAFIVPVYNGNDVKTSPLGTLLKISGNQNGRQFIKGIGG